MAAPPVPPRPFDDYDAPHRQVSLPPAVPPLPSDFKPEQEQYSSGPHFEDPLVAPRPQKLQPDLPKNMAQSLDEQLSLPPARQGQIQNASFPNPALAGASNYLGYPPQGPPVSRAPPGPPPASNWSPWSPPPPQQQAMAPSFPMPFSSSGLPINSPDPSSLSGSMASISIGPRNASPVAAPSGARDGPPSLTAPLPTIATLSVQQSSIQHPNADPARRIVWCRDVLALVDRAQQLHVRSSPTSTDPVVGPAQIDDPDLQKLVNVAIPIILQIASQQPQGPLPPYVAEAIYMRAMCASTGVHPQFIPHDPRSAFRDFERAAKSGYHAAWFKLGREYENFGDVQHAKECFERGTKHGVESCFYRLGMAHLMGQLGFPADPQAALPLLNRAATLATIEVPQPAYVYGLLLLNEFTHVSIPPHLFQSLLPPGIGSSEEARRHLERAAYLNFAPAQYKLGHAYEFATPPFPFDALLSVQYYSLASQQGEIEADMALSKWFLCGAEGAFDKDEGLAWTFAEKAARKQLPSAEFALGYYSEVGVGGPRNVDAARKWYQRAAQHGNTDAAERLQALAQPTPQTLSREQHENLTDTKLVRRRTQAKQRSESIQGPITTQSVPAAHRTQIVNSIRKNSISVGPTGMADYVNGPSPNYPPAAGQAAPLPRVDEYGGGRRIASGPSGAPPPAGQPYNDHNTPSGVTLSDEPQYQPHPAHQRVQASAPANSARRAGTPPMRRQGGATPQTQTQTPSQTPLPPVQSPATPPARPPTKGPQTFAEMGVATAKVQDDSNCVVM